MGAKEEEEHKELVVASYDGTVLWVPPVKYKSSCEVDETHSYNIYVPIKEHAAFYYYSRLINPYVWLILFHMDMTYYPFDVQKCVLKFGSWSYNSHQLNLQAHSDPQVQCSPLYIFK